MIPVCSWIWYGGRSRCCHRRLSWQYPIVELITGIGFVLIFMRSIIFNNFSPLSFIFYLLVFTLCFTIFLQDIKYQAIHEGLLYALLLTTITFLVINNYSEFQNLITYGFKSRLQILGSKFLPHVLIVLLSSLPFFLLYKLSRERWLGEGDVWLAGWMGLFLGFPRVFWALYFGIIFGGVVSLIIILLKLKKMRDTISLGPFLLIGTLFSLLI